jgi:hypothetical protein
MKSNAQLNTILSDEIEEKKSIKKIGSIGLACQTCDPGQEMRTTQ